MKIIIEASSLDELFKIVDGMRTSKKDDSILNATVDYLDLSNASVNRLKSANIATIGDLIQYAQTDLLKIPKFGLICLNDIKDALRREGLHLKDGFV